MVKLEYTWSAVEDLKNIHKYISLNSSAAASRYVRLLKDKIKILKSHPEIGKPIHRQRFEHLRQLLYQSCRIIYEFQDNKVLLLLFNTNQGFREICPPLKTLNSNYA